LTDIQPQKLKLLPLPRWAKARKFEHVTRCINSLLVKIKP
jgi:hypothetical protein